MSARERLLVALLIFALGMVGLATQTLRQSIRALSLLPFLILGTAYIQDSWPEMIEMHQNGQGYTSERWQASALVQTICDLPADVPLLTNRSAVLYLATERGSTQIPWKLQPTTLEPNKNYRKWVERAVAKLRKQGGLVYFTTVSPRSYDVSLDELREIVPTEVVLETTEGVLLRPLWPSEVSTNSSSTTNP